MSYLIWSPCLRRGIFFVILQKPSIKQFTLHKNQRIKKQKEIDLLFNSGKNFFSFPFKVYYTVSDLQPGAEPLLFGTGVGKKYFKRAVDRNRIKRLSREAFRTQNLQLKEALKASAKQLRLFMIFAGKDLPEMPLVAEKTRMILEKLTLEIQNTHA